MTAARALLLAALMASGCGGGTDEPLPTAEPIRGDAGNVFENRPDPQAVIQHHKDPIVIITARESVNIAATTAGKLADVYVRRGDDVTEGQVLFKLDEDSIREELAISTAAVRAQRVAARQAGVELAEATAQLKLERKLFGGGSTSKTSVDEAEFRKLKASAALERARADVQTQEARVDQLRRRLGDTTVVAPSAGKISERYLDPGGVVQPGSPILRLISTGPLWARFALSAEQVGTLEPGDQVEIVVEALKTSLSAVIKQVAPEMDPATQLIFVEAELSIPEELKGRVQSGLTGRVKLAGAVKRSADVPP